MERGKDRGKDREMQKKRERAKEKDEKDSHPLQPPPALGQRREWKFDADVGPCGGKERREAGAWRVPGLPLRPLAVARGERGPQELKRDQYPQLRAESPGIQLGPELGGKSGCLGLGPCSAHCVASGRSLSLSGLFPKMAGHFPGGSVSGAFMVSGPSRALWHRLESTDSGVHSGVHILTPFMKHLLCAPPWSRSQKC